MHPVPLERKLQQIAVAVATVKASRPMSGAGGWGVGLKDPRTGQSAEHAGAAKNIPKGHGRQSGRHAKDRRGLHAQSISPHTARTGPVSIAFKVRAGRCVASLLKFSYPLTGNIFAN